MKRIGAILLIIAMVFSLTCCKGGRADYDCDKEIKDIIGFLKSEAEAGENEELLKEGGYIIPGDSLSDWIAILLSRNDVQDDFDGYLKRLEKKVEELYEKDGGLDRVKATEWHRISLAIIACGGDPAKAGKTKKGENIDLIKDGTYMWRRTENISTQGNNALIFALITLDSLGYQCPENSIYDRERLIRNLLEEQEEDGGFGLSRATGSDADITAMALQALAPYYDSSQKYVLEDGREVTVKECADRAVDFLSDQMKEDGRYTYGNGYSSETSSQIIIALCALGIDPAEDKRFEKNGVDIVEGLLTYKAEGGGYAHTVEPEGKLTGNVMASEQAGRAFTALKMFKEGKGSYYDFG